MRSLHPVAVTLAALALSACATSVNLTGSDIAPAAQGVVKVSPCRNVNLGLKVYVHYLAPPERLGPGATVFIVWARPLTLGALPQNLGVLQINRNLEGSLTTLTPLHSFELLVTPEPSGTMQTPTGVPVLTARIVCP